MTLVLKTISAELGAPTRPMLRGASPSLISRVIVSPRSEGIEADWIGTRWMRREGRGVVGRGSPNPETDRSSLNIWAEEPGDDGRGGVYVSLPGDVCDR
jgi:hypothetical protein